MYIIIYNNYAVLCDLLKENNPTAEIVLMTPTYNDQGIDTHSCLDAYSNMVIQLANDKGFKYIDLHKLWMEHLIVGSDNCGQRDRLSSCTGDACLFSKKGAEATAQFFSEIYQSTDLSGKTEWLARVSALAPAVTPYTIPDAFWKQIRCTRGFL